MDIAVRRLKEKEKYVLRGYATLFVSFNKLHVST